MTGQNVNEVAKPIYETFSNQKVPPTIFIMISFVGY